MLSWLSARPTEYEEDSDKDLEEIEQVTAESESDSDSEGSEDEDEDEDTYPFLRKHVADIGEASFYKTSARDLVLAPMWTFQRCIDEDHVKKLVAEFKSSGGAIGTTKALRDQLGKVRIIDGQHRLAAWRKIMEKDAKWNLEVMLEVYDVESFESRKGLAIFRNANNVKNMSMRDLPHDTARRLVARFKTEWPNQMRRPKEGKRVYRPNMDTRILYQKLREYCEVSSLDEEYIWKRALESNTMRGLWSAKRHRCTIKTLEKARVSGLYLSLDLDYNWLDQID